MENATDKSIAVVTSLATVLNRTFQTRSSLASSLIDKCPQFVSKEKRQKIFSKASKKAVQRQRHNFELKQYFQIKYCNHSMELIWGVAPQAYQCTRKYCHSANNRPKINKKRCIIDVKSILYRRKIGVISM